MGELLSILYNFIVTPLIYLVEIVFALLYRIVDNPGLAIVGVSLVVNFLCLPLYRMADRLQEEERLRQESLSFWVNHIKRHFKGDEQYMMLTAYYREQGYSPLQALNSSISLLLQIPIFMAAYSFLSDLPALRGAPFLFIEDLSKPDALIAIGGITINLLPVAMTLLNCLSTVIYTRGLGLRDKIQAYGLALVFLVLLYDSPSGLVLYWTLNQVFSVVKNIVLPRGIDVGVEDELAASTNKDASMTTRTFVLAGLVITALTGILIPSALIAASTSEFINIYEFVNPLRYLISTTSIVGGFVLLWIGVFYYLSKERARQDFALVLTSCAAVFLVDYFFFGRNLGIINASLIFDVAPEYSLGEKLFNGLVLVGVVAAVIFVWKLRPSVINPVLGILLLAIIGLSVPNVKAIYTSAEKIKADIAAEMEKAVEVAAQEEETEPAAGVEGEPAAASAEVAANGFFNADGSIRPLFTLSRGGKNVLVIFLDRAIGAYVPYLINEKPELKEALDGFTFYPNTLSFGRFTNFGTPGLYGGYDYSVEAINARDDVSLKDKQNEALLVMPKLFSEQGFEVTFLDPTYVDYDFNSSDLSLFDSYEHVRAYNVNGVYADTFFSDYNRVSKLNFRRNLCFYSLFKVVPVALQRRVYDGGTYFSTSVNHDIRRSFIENYSVIAALRDMTRIDEGASNNVLIMSNCMTHEPDILQMPNYEPSTFVDNRQYEDQSRFTLDGRAMDVSTKEYLKHYHANMAALLRLGEWFDYLREQGVYDNTRIIVVADHGAQFGQFSDMLFYDDTLDVEAYNPLLLVKDFDAHGFTVDESFMTNADTPVIALSGLVDDPVNPFTGNPITSDEKNAHPQLVTTSGNWHLEDQAPTQFDTSDGLWFTVHDNIFDEGNWEPVE